MICFPLASITSYLQVPFTSAPLAIDLDNCLDQNAYQCFHAYDGQCNHSEQPYSHRIFVDTTRVVIDALKW